MKELIPTTPAGPSLRRELLKALDAAIDKHRTTLHPEDAQMAPMELRSWMKACDERWDREMLESSAGFAWHTVRTCRRPASPRDARLFDMRMPHALYALAALKHRFGVDITEEVTA